MIVAVKRARLAEKVADGDIQPPVIVVIGESNLAERETGEAGVDLGKLCGCGA